MSFVMFRHHTRWRRWRSLHQSLREAPNRCQTLPEAPNRCQATRTGRAARGNTYTFTYSKVCREKKAYSCFVLRCPFGWSAAWRGSRHYKSFSRQQAWTIGVHISHGLVVGGAPEMEEPHSNCSCGQRVVFCTVLVTLLVLTTVDLCTTAYSLQYTEDFLTWLDGESMLSFIFIFIAFGSISIVLLLPQTILFLAAGFACSSRMDSPWSVFVVALSLSLVTFILGASVAFSLARSVLPPSCTRKFYSHFAILEGLDHALQHKGRRMVILLRINPMAPYNALNYGLGLSSCTFRDYLEGMVGAVPYACIAVYAGMIISSVEDIDSLFSYTSTGWYCVYAALAVICVVSLVAIVKYTSAEMKAAIRSAPRRGGHGVDGAVDGEIDIGELPPDSTMFGTFTARRGGDGHGSEGGGGGGGEDDEKEAVRVFDEIVVAREPLLGRVDSRRKNSSAVGSRPAPGAKGRLHSAADI